MNYISHYNSPLGSITLASDGYALIGLWFDGQKHLGTTLGDGYEKNRCLYLTEQRRGLIFTLAAEYQILHRISLCTAQTFAVRYGIY